MAEVIYGENEVELIKVGIRSEGKATEHFAVVYVPPKTRSWNSLEHKEMQKETLLNLEKLIDCCGNLTIMGDFNCKEVNWEEWTTEGSDESWGSEILKLAMESTPSQ